MDFSGARASLYGFLGVSAMQEARVSLTENQRRLLESYRTKCAEQQAADAAALMPWAALGAFRRHMGISQIELAKRLSRISGDWITQRHISYLECGKPDRARHLLASRYFRRLGYDVDGTGDSIHVQPRLSEGGDGIAA